MPRAEHDRRRTLEDIVAELVRWYDHPGDSPADHRCVKSLGYDPSLGYSERVDADGHLQIHKSACDHRTVGAPLVERLELLVEPGSAGPRENKGTVGKSPKGSPAPWAAAPAELIDEIRRGVIDLHTTARAVLRLKPPTFSDMPLEARAYESIHQLPADLEMLRGRGMSQHYLVTSECPGRPQCTVEAEHEHPGVVERRLRSWHRRARILTGHEVRAARVGQVQNPNHPANTERYVRGPVCPASGPASCFHESCLQLRLDRQQKYQQARCPYCDSVSLQQDPDEGHVICSRPSCRDEEGHRRMWTVRELARLGLVIVDEQTA